MIDQHIRISSSCFREMILFSGKYGNRLMSPDDLQHVYGIIGGKDVNVGTIDILQFIPLAEGSISEKTLKKSEIDTKLMDDELSLFGFFHAFPNSGSVLSEQDILNLKSFGVGSLCIIFDFTKVGQFNNGFLVYQLDEEYVKNTPYTIVDPENEDKYYFARSLVNLSEKYERSGSISPEGLNFYKAHEIDSSKVEIDSKSEIGSKYLVEIPQPSFEEYELSLIEQDFEIQKLRNDINQASKESKSSAYMKLQLASRLISHNAHDSEILRYLESAEEEFQVSEDRESKLGLAITKNEMGLFYEERGNFYTALNYFDDSYNLLVEIGDKKRNIRVLNNIGNIYYKLNNFDTALMKYNDAYSLADDLPDKVMIFNNIAEVYLKLRNYGRAFSILVKNAEFFEKTENDYGLSMVFSKLGVLYYTQGIEYYTLAKKYIHLALSIKKRHKYYRECIQDYELLSKIYLEEKSYHVAEDNLVQGLNLVRTLGFEQKESFFYENLGKLYFLEEKIEECLEYLEFAQESYAKFGDKESEGRVLEKMGEIVAKNNNELSQSLEYYEKALKSYKEENFRRKQADVIVKIAEIHLDLGEKFTAIEKLHEAHNLYKTMYDETTAKIIFERIKSLEI